MKTNLHKVTLQHDEDRVKLSSHLKDAIGKEKGKWNNDVIELKVSDNIFLLISVKSTNGLAYRNVRHEGKPSPYNII
jgi:hypothetical protein